MRKRKHSTASGIAMSKLVQLLPPRSMINIHQNAFILSCISRTSVGYGSKDVAKESSDSLGDDII
jgi:hypothetical protein